MATAVIGDKRFGHELTALVAKRNVALPVIMALGVGLRLFQLGTPSLWYDEVLSILVSAKDPRTIVSLTANDVHPPLYYWMLHFWLVFGQSEFAVRLLSVLFGLATVVAVYFLSERLFDNRVALLAALTTAMAPFQVTYSQEARMYSLLAFLSVLSSLFLVKAIGLPRFTSKETVAGDTSRATREDSKHGWLWWLLFALCTTLSFYTAYYAIFTLLAQELFLMLFLGHWKKLIGGWLWSHALMVIAFLPWVFVLWKQATAVMGSYWISQPHFLNLFKTITMFTVSYSVPSFLAAVGLFLSLVVLLMAIRTGIPHLFSKSRGAPALLISLILVPILTAYAVSFVRPIYLDRGLISSSPPLYIMLSFGALIPRRRLIPGIFTVLLLAFLPISLGNYYFNPAFAKSPMREAADFVSSEFVSGDTVLHTSTGSFLPFVLYQPKLDQHLLPEDPAFLQSNRPSQTILSIVGDSGPPESFVPAHKRVWLVVALDHSEEYQKSLKTWFDTRYPVLQRYDVGLIGILLYDVQSQVKS